MTIATATSNTVSLASTVSAVSPHLLAIATLARRELVRFFRQPTRVVGAIGQPLIFWILFGSGLRGSFQAPGFTTASRDLSFQEYFFPGIAVLIVLFTAIFSTISIIEDRREGFLQGVLVAPVSRFAIVFGKLCGGSLLAVMQAAAFLAMGPLLASIGLAPQMSIDVSVGSAILCLLFLNLIAFELTALGYVIAWPMTSTQGFHAIMSVFLMPMWLLSGAFFPGDQSGWLSWVIRLNPLTYGVAGLRRLLYGGGLQNSGLPGLGICLGVTILCTLCLIVLCVLLTNRRSVSNVR